MPELEPPYDGDEEPSTRYTVTCTDLDRRGHWDMADCCTSCHDEPEVQPLPVSLPHPKGGNVLVRACCALHEYLHSHLVKGHEDFLGDLFGGDD